MAGGGTIATDLEAVEGEKIGAGLEIEGKEICAIMVMINLLLSGET